MRTAVICLVGSVAGLLTFDLVAAGNGPALVSNTLQAAPRQDVARERKGDRLQIAAPAQSGHKIATHPVAGSKPQPAVQKPKLPHGCEPAFSTLAGTAVSSLHARCLADLRMPVRFAALR